MNLVSFAMFRRYLNMRKSYTDKYIIQKCFIQCRSFEPDLIERAYFIKSKIETCLWYESSIKYDSFVGFSCPSHMRIEACLLYICADIMITYLFNKELFVSWSYLWYFNMDILFISFDNKMLLIRWSFKPDSHKCSCLKITPHCGQKLYVFACNTLKGKILYQFFIRTLGFEYPSFCFNLFVCSSILSRVDNFCKQRDLRNICFF